MVRHSLLLPSLLLLQVTSSLTSDCVPGKNCKVPNCRCWDDPTTPGKISRADTPQMVLLSFEYAINSGNVKSYSTLFEDLYNPNKCQTTATFFAQKKFTSSDAINYLYRQGHEIGMTSESGTVPADWPESFKTVKQFLVESGIPSSKIIGTRAPQLLVGGDDQMDALQDNKLRYDASCVTRQTNPASMLWPYTYNFIDLTPKCLMGTVPKSTHPGIWQFVMAALEFNSTLPCATPSACSPYLRNRQDAFDFLNRNFVKHYNGKRTPFNLFIDAQWLSVKYQADATRQFLHYIRAGFSDTWIISHNRALAWIMKPVPSDHATKYPPWNC